MRNCDVGFIPALVHPRSCDDSQNGIDVFESSGKLLPKYKTHFFSATTTVGALVKRLRLASGAEEICAGRFSRMHGHGLEFALTPPTRALEHCADWMALQGASRDNGCATGGIVGEGMTRPSQMVAGPAAQEFLTISKGIDGMG